MRRREFIAGLAGAAASPLAARAQQPAPRPRRIGMLNSFAESDPIFRVSIMETYNALAQLGWESGRNVQIVERWVGGNPERAPMLAKEMVALQPALIIAVGGLAADALHRESSTIPIVLMNVPDPVESGLVPSLARPGGNMTGIANSEPTFGGKLLSLLKRIAPRIKVAAAAFNPDTAPSHGSYHLGSFDAAARSVGIEPIAAQVRSDADIEQVIASLARQQGGIVVIPDVFMNIHRGAVIAHAIRNNVPAIYDNPNFAREGGLIQYGPNFRESYRRAAFYVDRILRGANPADLPIELPTRYTLVINLKTAKAIGLDPSPDMISIADEVIE